MIYLALKSKTSKGLLLILGILLLGSCKNGNRLPRNQEVDLTIDNSQVETEWLVGSWLDTSASALHFTLFKNGTAHSDNMSTLLYKKWTVKGKQVTFTVESIGNGTSSTDNVTYTIEKLTINELILRKGPSRLRYKKK